MKLFQPYYLIAILIGAGIFYYDAYNRKQASVFYGFAENKDTEVNFNYPVIVKKIYVSEGQFTYKGDLLFHLQRINPKEQLADEDYRINELRAESIVWKAKREGELKLMDAEYRIKRQDFISRISKINTEIDYRKKIYGDLISLKDENLTLQKLKMEKESIENELQLTDSLYQQEIDILKKELQLGNDPYLYEIQRLDAKKKFDEAQQIMDIEIKAPHNGLVGNINCKEEEHIPSFRTLLNYYEPNPTMVKGYLHEDLLLEVEVNDSITIRSINDPLLKSEGIITGMGSRIVEIPTRLRKIPDIKTYGREVLIIMPADNPFIQKEKVAIEIR